MTIRPLLPLPSFSGVAAGATATLNLPLGETYHAVVLEYRESGTLAGQATMEAGITEVRVNINGITVRRLSAEDIIDINAYHGIAFQAGFLPIYFSEPYRRTPQGEDFLALGTADLQSVQIEVDVAAGATSPTLKAVKDVERVRRNMGQIKKMLKKNYPITQTGENTINGDILDSIHAMHFKSASISDLVVKVDSSEVFNATAAQNSQRLTNLGKAPQSGFFHLDFAPGDRIGDILEMVVPNGFDGKGNPTGFKKVQDFAMVFNMAAATSFNVVEERIGTL